MLYDENRPLTLAEIQADPKLHESLVTLAKKRYMASADYVQPWHERFVRYYKVYRSILDAVDDADEANYMISYAYGIVEDLVSQISEPLLQMTPPCRVAAKRVGHEQSADNFSSIAANYFRTSRYQLEYTESVRECVITGNSWEFDGWANDYCVVRRWKKVQRETMLGKLKSMLTGAEYPSTAMTPYESIEEVEENRPEKVGYFTRFPSIFDVFPEPGIKNVRDMHWLIEVERSVAIADLQKRMYVDPKTKQLMPFFDFGPMLRAVGAHEPGSITPTPLDIKNDYGREAREAMSGRVDTREDDPQLDMDKVSLQWIWEKNRVYCLANGSHIVAYREKVFQQPRLPYRIKGYTPQKEFLFSLGAIEPIESQLQELKDIHTLSMRNWVRIINRMVAFNEESIPFLDDFKPRAGGKIRVRAPVGGSVANEIVPIEQSDVTQSMLAQESNTKGLIERVISVVDYAPGVDGTKQTHKTLGGLIEIQNNVARRTTTVRRMFLASYQDQMWFMEKLYSQFLLDKQPFTIYGPDGSTRLSQFDLWDINTDGVGFDFVIEYDPSFGDDQLKRNQNMVLLDLALKYENARITLGRADLPEVDLGEIMRRNFKSFGWSDTSKILQMPDGQLDPMAEFNLMLDGQPVAPHPDEDLVAHLIEHTIQRNSPKFRKAIADGTMDGRALALLDAHIQATQMRIAAVLQNPQAVAEQKVAQAAREAGMVQRQPLPGAAGGDPVMSAGSMNGGMAGMGLTVPNTRTPTPRDSGMPEAV